MNPPYPILSTCLPPATFVLISVKPITCKIPSMTLEQFKATLSEPCPPPGLHPLLQALWHDARGDWQIAHTIAQSHEGAAPYDRLHAYLHRKEGDTSNAAYWYRRANAERYTGALDQEWNDLVEEFL